MSFDCFLRSKDGKNCGPSHGVSGVVWLADGNDEEANHPIGCHYSKEALSKKEVKPARAGLFNFPQEDLNKMWICYRYRHMLGKFWRRSKVTCQYPEHSGDTKRARGRAGVNLEMAKKRKLFGVVVHCEF